jgi:hypothetical protein
MRPEAVVASGGLAWPGRGNGGARSKDSAADPELRPRRCAMPHRAARCVAPRVAQVLVARRQDAMRPAVPGASDEAVCSRSWKAAYFFVGAGAAAGHDHDDENVGAEHQSFTTYD